MFSQPSVCVSNRAITDSFLVDLWSNQCTLPFNYCYILLFYILLLCLFIVSCFCKVSVSVLKCNIIITEDLTSLDLPEASLLPNIFCNFFYLVLCHLSISK